MLRLDILDQGHLGSLYSAIGGVFAARIHPSGVKEPRRLQVLEGVEMLL